MSAFPQFHRHHEIRRVRGDLERDSFPRLQMFLLVTLTGAAGFVASYILLHAGFVEMWLRYLASFGVAYLMFLFLLWLWLRTRAEDYADLPDISGSPSSGSGSSGTCYSGKGGEFGGGGANGSFDAPSESISVISDSGSSVGDALGTGDCSPPYSFALRAHRCNCFRFRLGHGALCARGPFNWRCHFSLEAGQLGCDGQPIIPPDAAR
ncbi:MAG: hypothetical protein K8R50_02835 [Betaproteobacteria bacterium]|nr:hypothetical protein [Betaproteobacteria bacterium]